VTYGEERTFPSHHSDETVNVTVLNGKVNLADATIVRN